MAFLRETALVFCEDQFGLPDGKTAAGLVRASERYDIVGVIDLACAGQDAGEALGEASNGIPIFASLDEAISQLSNVPSYYIYGKAPLETYIPDHERLLILKAMEKGMNIVSGLHEFFSEDPEFLQMAIRHNVRIQDIRKPPSLKDLHVYTGAISRVNIPVVAVLGTDCACGKMTTAVELNKTLQALGLKSVLVATGQTSLMQGAQYGVSIDALVSQFVIGEIEHAVVQAFDQEHPDIILVEGQSAVSHPAFMGSMGILKGCLPNGVILQHPPARRSRCDFPMLPMPQVETERRLIEATSTAKVMAIALSHEAMTKAEVEQTIVDYEQRLELPTMDVLSDGCDKLVQALGNHFPLLGQKIQQNSLEKQVTLELI